MTDARFQSFETEGDPTSPIKTLNVTSSIVGDQFNVNIKTQNLHQLQEAKLTFAICQNLCQKAFSRFENISVKATDQNAVIIMDTIKALRAITDVSKASFDTLPLVKAK